jgi:uncharacterized protein
VIPTDPRPARRRRWPVPRSILIGIAPAALFAIFTAIRARPSDDYDSTGTTLDNVIHGLLLPELITGGVIALIVTALGWWPIVWHDRKRGAPAWAWIAPLLALAIALLHLPIVRWGHQSSEYFLLLALGTLLVGFFEETMARGMLVAGFRARLPELWVWLLSCAIFGSLHLLNALSGEPFGNAVIQAFFAASFGSALYIARRLTRTLLAPIVLHAVWDFASIAVVGTTTTNSLITAGGGIEALLALVGLLTIGAMAFAVVAGVFVALHADAGSRRSRAWTDVPPLEAFAVRDGGHGLQSERWPIWR